MEKERKKQQTVSSKRTSLSGKKKQSTSKNETGHLPEHTVPVTCKKDGDDKAKKTFDDWSVSWP